MLSQNVVFTRTARCVKILGKGVVKVVHRCDAAKENQQLGKCGGWGMGVILILLTNIGILG